MGIILDPSKRLDVEARQNQDYDLSFDLDDSNGDPFSTTGYVFALEVFNHAREKKINLTAGSGLTVSTGNIDAIFSASDLDLPDGDYNWFLRVTNPSGQKQTWVHGNFRLIDKNYSGYVYASSSSTLTINDGANTVTISITLGGGGSITDAEVEAAYNNQVDIVPQGTAETGTSTTVYRWTPQRVAQAIGALATGGGDMLKSTYDPGAVNDDVFDMENMSEGVTNKIFNASERSKLSGIESGATADQSDEEIQDAVSSMLDHAAHTRATVSYEDSNNRWVITVTPDMQSSIYDPTNVAGDAFSMGNMEETSSSKVFTATERSKLSGIEDGATTDQTDAEIESAYNSQVPIVSQGDAQAGTSQTVYRWTPERVAEAINAIAQGGGDMLKSTYDPGSVNDDAFDMGNMSEGTTNKIFTSTERSKLDGIESGATADQTNSEIETAYNAQVGVVSQVNAEAGTSTTVYRWTPQRVKQAIEALGGDMTIATYDPTGVGGDAFDMDNMVEGTTNKILTAAERSKLSGIEANATADQTDEEIQDAVSGMLDHAAHTGASISYEDVNNRWVVTISADMQKSVYDPGTVEGDAFDMGNMSEGTTNKIFTATERSKLDGIESGATADQSDAEIETAYNNQVSVVDQSTAETGTSTDVYRWTPQRVKQAIDASDTFVDKTTDESIGGNKLFTAQANMDINTVSFTATPTFNFNNGNVQEMVITGDVTSLAVSNKVNGGTYIIFLVQDGTGGHSMPTPAASFGTKTANSADFDTTANAVNIVTINVRSGGNTYYSIETV